MSNSTSPDPRIAALLKAAWDEGFGDVMTYADAAAILTALDGWTLVPVGTAAADVQRDYERHRRIEEAARAVIDERPYHGGQNALDALRAALEDA